MGSQKRNHTITVLAAFTALNLVFIWTNSILSIELSSHQSSFITSILQHIFRNADTGMLEHIIRKCAHFAEFACLGALSFGLTYAICEFDFRRAWAAAPLPVIGCLLAASTDETIQIFSDRGNSVADVLLDFSGSLTAIAVFCVVLLMIDAAKRRKSPPETFEEDAADESDAPDLSESDANIADSIGGAVPDASDEEEPEEKT